MSNEGAVQNFEWDGVWQAAATIDEAGWDGGDRHPFPHAALRSRKH